MTTREEWAKRVERWQESNLTAKEFAAELGINVHTLSHWKWKLRKEAARVRWSLEGASRKKKGSRTEATELGRPRFVEVTGTPWPVASERIEIVVDGGIVVRVPDGFDAETLARVLTTMSGRAER